MIHLFVLLAVIHFKTRMNPVYQPTPRRNENNVCQHEHFIAQLYSLVTDKPKQKRRYTSLEEKGPHIGAHCIKVMHISSIVFEHVTCQ